MCGIGLFHAEASSRSITAVFLWFHQNSFVILLGDSCCHTIDMAYSNHSRDDIQHYIAISITQFKFWAILTQYQIPLRYILNFPNLSRYPSTPRSLSKSNPSDGFTFVWGRNNPECLSQLVLTLCWLTRWPFLSVYPSTHRSQCRI